MKIEELWRELESESHGSTAWAARLARPDPGYPLQVALECASGSRALLLPVPRAVIPPRRTWPDCQGLDVLLVAMGTDTHVAVRLRDPASADVFTALAEDVAARVAVATDAAAAVSHLFDRLRHWQLFLATSREALTIDAQRGLFGELLFLLDQLVPALGPRASIEAWLGAAGANQDFQLPAAAIEVKSTTAKQPGSVRITSERQLDATGAGALFLLINLLDERDVPAVPDAPGETLPGLISRLRSVASPDAHGVATLNERLLKAGWVDAHAPRYEGRRWTLRSRRAFRVDPGFPCLVEARLPAGIGDVSYRLDLVACSSYEVDFGQILAAIGVSPGPATGGKHS